MKKAIGKQNKVEFSKYLSYLLRHNPSNVGLELSVGGYVSTKELIEAINNSENNPYIVTLLDLQRIVKEDKKQRYGFKEVDGDKFAMIRAHQGHSIDGLMMDFTLVNEPPRYLYHGTSVENARKIKESGILKPMSRQLVHLSKDLDTATTVAKRHGTPVIFRIDTKKAIKDGKSFMYLKMAFT